MGEVYLAEDTSLGRKVAIKFLSSDKASDPESRQRFVHEARAQAMLSHPNIATFYEVGEDQDKVFIVMEYIEGQPLSKLAQVEKLSLPEILDLAIQVGEGLTAAHEKGITHRDIKPENVLVTTKRNAKITDFGLAKWKGASTLTQTGARMGTAYYMSPEQVEGKKVDNRTDIFSLGVVLYELLCARRPFEGDTDTAVFYDLINTHPQPLARYARHLPDKLEQIVMKCLAKRPEERYQSVADFVADLRRLQRALTTGELEPVVQRKMLAVLPFENLGLAEDEYFADGITEEIITNLAKVSGLGVISRTSSMQYKKTDKKLRQIGSELGVDYILEGTIRWSKSGNNHQVRISAQLIRVKDDTHLWAETYDRVLEQIFALQSDIAANVTKALHIALLEPERQALATKPTDNLEAYDYYLRGNDYLYRGWAEKDLRIAIQMFQKAAELDSNFALAYANLSRSHSTMYWFDHDRTGERLTLAKDAVDRALALRPDLPEAHLALGFYYYWGSLDYERALAEFAIVQKSQPNSSDLFFAIGAVQRRQGKWEEMVANLKKAAELDPRSSWKAYDVGSTLINIRRYAEAEGWFDRAISLSPDSPLPYIWNATLFLHWRGDTAKARMVLQKASEKIALSELFSEFSDWYEKKLLLQIWGVDYLRRLAESPLESFGSDKASSFLFKAELYSLMNQPQLAQAHFGSASELLENKVQAQPEASMFHTQLGLAYAGLGRKEEAIREGKKGVELFPVSKDAFSGPDKVESLAEIYVRVGEYEAAIDQLGYLLSIPSHTSIPYLRVDPTWAPLRNHPRFQRLLAGKD